MIGESISAYERSVCASCEHNLGISCPANGSCGIRVKCDEKGNVNPKVFCSEQNESR